MAKTWNNYLKATKKGWKNESGTKKNQSKTRTHTQTHMVFRYKKKEQLERITNGNHVCVSNWEKMKKSTPLQEINQVFIPACCRTVSGG